MTPDELVRRLELLSTLFEQGSLTEQAYAEAKANLMRQAASEGVDLPEGPAKSSTTDSADSDSKPGTNWAPDLSSGPTDVAALVDAPPGLPASGQEMLERLRERDLISQAEFEERMGAAPAPPPSEPAEPRLVPPPLAPAPPGLTWSGAPQPATVPPWAPPPRERYPMAFDVAYPEHLSRWKTLLRVFLIIPVVIVGQLLQYFVFTALLIGWTTVFWRKKYPDWLFRGLAGAFAFGARSYAYALLVTDRFPSFSPEDSPVTLEFDQPPSGELSRWRVLFWKYILLLPNYFVLSFLWMAVIAVSVIAWFGILFTGNYPRGLFQFTVGVQRWTWRMAGYFASFNDRFPPYALSAEAGPASNGTTVANGVIGGLVVAGYAALIATTIALSGDYETEHVDYADLRAGRDHQLNFFAEDYSGRSVALELTRAVDPGNSLIEVLRPSPRERIIVFQWSVENSTRTPALVAGGAAQLKFSYGRTGSVETDSVTAALITVNNKTAPANVAERGAAAIQAVFVVPADATPVELWFRYGFAANGVKYVFD